jgi:hypothetical protein|tara:strand:+ start:200 stop:322 length:123 start_codon:yes stop_codon:yes gene_type:complete
MKQMIITLALLLSVLFLQGCQVIGLGLSAAAAYGLSQALK